jgi:hypothetical protein
MCSVQREQENMGGGFRFSSNLGEGGGGAVFQAYATVEKYSAFSNSTVGSTVCRIMCGGRRGYLLSSPCRDASLKSTQPNSGDCSGNIQMV